MVLMSMILDHKKSKLLLMILNILYHNYAKKYQYSLFFIETRELNFAPKFKEAIKKLQLTLKRLNDLARYVQQSA